MPTSAPDTLPGFLSDQKPRWCRTVEVIDVHGGAWTAPVILNERGGLAILVTYSKDFLPILSAAQQRAVEIATAARQALVAAAETDGAGLEIWRAAHWAAELLATIRPIRRETITVLDDRTTLAVLEAATGLCLRQVEIPDHCCSQLLEQGGAA